MAQAQRTDVLVVGAGLAGMLAALRIATTTQLRVTIVDKGPSFAQRSCPCAATGGCNPRRACHQISGIGGASTINGGKLCGFPAGSGITELVDAEQVADLQCILARIVGHDHSHIAQVLLKMSIKEHGGELQIGPATVWKKYPAMILLRPEMAMLIRSLLQALWRAKVDIVPRTRVESVQAGDEGFRVDAWQGDGELQISARTLVLATGRSGSSWITRLARHHGLRLKQNFVDIGFRLETNADDLRPLVRDYGTDAKLKFRTSALESRTFCVCLGGTIERVNWNGCEYADGSFDARLTSRANLALTVRVPLDRPESIDDLLQPFKAQPGLMFWDLPSFLLDRATSRTKRLAASAFSNLLPHAAHESLMHGVSELLEMYPHLLTTETRVVAPAIDHYWPNFQLGSGFETTLPGLYVIGDASGLARGYLQASWSGLACAEHIAASSRSERLSRHALHAF